jgi:uncharacterized protein YpiB (UPF0302 family)
MNKHVLFFMQMLLKRKENTWVLNLLNGTQMTKLFIVVMIVLYLDLKLPMESALITTNVVSSNPTQARCTRYNIM